MLAALLLRVADRHAHCVVTVTVTVIAFNAAPLLISTVKLS